MDVAGLIEQLTILALSDLIAPFEINIEDAALKALPSIAGKAGLPPGLGGELESIVRAFDTTITKTTKPGANWGRTAFAAAGVAVIAIAPYSLVALAPAGAAGAAALTGGLAALGPGGMVGGIAAIGGTAGTGAAITTAAAVGGREDGARLNSGQLLLATAVALHSNVSDTITTRTFGGRRLQSQPNSGTGDHCRGNQRREVSISRSPDRRTRSCAEPGRLLEVKDLTPADMPKPALE